jgi:two-component system, NtrC family, nitrogen regulation sensor histidine kinase NtrY
MLAIISEKFILSDRFETKKLTHFSESFRKNHQLLKTSIADAENEIKNNRTTDKNSPSIQNIKLKNSSDEFSFVITKNDTLLYWSSNNSAFIELLLNNGDRLKQFPNGWYYHEKTQVDEYVIHGLLLIKREYKIQNNFLEGRFAKSYRLPGNYVIETKASDNSFPVSDSENGYAFSLKKSDFTAHYHYRLIIPAIFFTISFCLFLIIIYLLNAHWGHKISRAKGLAMFLFLSGLYLLFNHTRLPHSVFSLNLFSPNQFAFTWFWPSLGELLFFSVLLFFLALNYYRSVSLSFRKTSARFNPHLLFTGLILFAALLFVFVRFMVYSLVMNSTISFALYRIEEINAYSVVGYFIIALLLLTFLLFSSKVYQQFRKEISSKEYFFIVTSVFLSLFLLFPLFDKTGTFRLNFFFLPLMIMNYLVNRKGIFSHRMMGTILYVFLFTLFTLFAITRFINLHEDKVQETIALNLSSEHDPAAELFLKETDSEINNDSALQLLLTRSWDDAENYLKRKYFGGYFREYDVQVTLCGEHDSLVITPHNITEHCASFFDEMLEGKGTQLGNTHFYYMENSSGRISYFGKFVFKANGAHSTLLFIELNSRPMSEGLGFPELLLPQHSIESRMKNSFSFAKYFENQLVDRGGKFMYPLSVNPDTGSINHIKFEEWDGFRHCLYTYSSVNCVIVSRPVSTGYHYLVSFPYVFLFFFVLSMLIYLISKPLINNPFRYKSLRMKIHFSIVGIVFATLLVVGGGTIWYIISNYRNNYKKDLLDKINTVLVEVESIVGNSEKIEGIHPDYFNYELIRLSDVFRTDIMVFDLQGRLVSTSRPELFEKGLKSRWMDFQVFREFQLKYPSSYVINETVGSMRFLSAYMPIMNELGKKAGYLNVPYFTREKEFRQQLTMFVLAFVNIYILLFMVSIFVAYIISTRITDSLRLIRQHIQHVQLGKQPAPIGYISNDEIGVLVKEYNSKVEELAKSAELLASTERELAWREMAKQVAHEIKNPLTPMKLNIQFLQKTNPNEIENYSELLKKVSETLIEQIDNLSSIATEFSNFAQMPKARNEKFNLSEKLSDIVFLYSNTGECEIVHDFKELQGLVVYADKEQFARAIINIMKNAVQSIPEGRNGNINVSVTKQGSNAIIQIADNGKGIPDELKESIFKPNFTTKSSGAGLGLAITRNIVLSFGGEIWFESEQGKGSVFYIKMPVAKG